MIFIVNSSLFIIVATFCPYDTPKSVTLLLVHGMRFHVHVEKKPWMTCESVQFLSCVQEVNENFLF